jgi:5-methylcytosine-specific restriction endonuclease McrA
MTKLRTLVLNSNYMPISLLPLHSISAEDAVTRIFSDNCHVVFEYNREILTPNLKMKWPSVIARNSTLRYKNKVKLRKESLYYRDHGICVYCEKHITIKEFSVDHVFPRARGGTHSWDNVVCACISCNIKKGHKLPSGEWKPKVAPYEPDYYQLLAFRKKFPITVPDISWANFLSDWEAEIRVLQ